MKKIIILLVTLCLFYLQVSSETLHTSYELIYDGENISVEQKVFSQPENLFNPSVNVLRSQNGQMSIIYSGFLSGYADGKFSDVNFSGLDYVAVLQQTDTGLAVTYIIPTANQEVFDSVTNGMNLGTLQSAAQTVELRNTIASGTVQTNMTLMYNGKYYENVLLPGETLHIPIAITNTGSSSMELASYIAIYDLTGKLLDVTQSDTIFVPAQQKVETTLTKEFMSGTSCTAKIFLWQKNSMKPVAGNVYLTMQNQDYYADTYTAANEIDINKQLCGVINTSTDIDIVKFTPETTGLYALQLDASSGTICGLYDGEQTLLNSVSAVTDKNYLLYSLTANQDYYIQFNGAENNSYEITPALPSELITLTKNIGASSSLSESYDYNVYKFTPTTTGSYVITAVDSSNVKADLYNASFEKVASSDVSDTSVSFRITNNMTANQTYYVVVYPKSETSLGTYTMYVEEPFNVIAVQ